MSSVFQLLGVNLAVPDPSAVSRRVITLPSIFAGRLPAGTLRQRRALARLG